MEEKKIHVLEAPIVLNSSTGGFGVLPPGATLEYDKSFPEGFARYKVFVNVEGAQLEHHTPDPPERVAPLSGFVMPGPLTPEELKRVLDALEVDRATLEQVLEAYDE